MAQAPQFKNIFDSFLERQNQSMVREFEFARAIEQARQATAQENRLRTAANIATSRFNLEVPGLLQANAVKDFQFKNFLPQAVAANNAASLRKLEQNAFQAAFNEALARKDFNRMAELRPGSYRENLNTGKVEYSADGNNFFEIAGANTRSDVAENAIANAISAQDAQKRLLESSGRSPAAQPAAGTGAGGVPSLSAQELADIQRSDAIFGRAILPQGDTPVVPSLPAVGVRAPRSPMDNAYPGDASSYGPAVRWADDYLRKQQELYRKALEQAAAVGGNPFTSADFELSPSP